MFHPSTEYHTNDPSLDSLNCIESSGAVSGKKIGISPSYFRSFFCKNSSRSSLLKKDFLAEGNSCMVTQLNVLKIFFETESALFALENDISEVYACQLSSEIYELGKVLKLKDVEKLEKELKGLRNEVSSIRVYNNIAPLVPQMNSLRKTIGNVPVALSVAKWINVVDKALENLGSLQSSVNLISGNSNDLFARSLSVSQLLDEIEGIQDRMVTDLQSFGSEVTRLSRFNDLLSGEKPNFSYYL